MAKKKIYRAGMLLYKVDESQIRMLFMVPSKAKYGGAVPQCPKGKIEEGETAEEAAIREAQEEVGLFPPNIDGDIHHLGNFLGRTEVFVAKIKDEDMFGDFHFETVETRWMTPEEFQKDGRDLHKPMVKAAIRYIKKKEKI